MQPRFVPLSDVAEMLSISASQAYALVRSGELRAIKVGGRGQWRVEIDEIESYIERSYAATAQGLEDEHARECAEARPAGAARQRASGPGGSAHR